MFTGIKGYCVYCDCNQKGTLFHINPVLKGYCVYCVWNLEGTLYSINPVLKGYCVFRVWNRNVIIDICQKYLHKNARIYIYVYCTIYIYKSYISCLLVCFWGKRKIRNMYFKNLSNFTQNCNTYICIYVYINIYIYILI